MGDLLKLIWYAVAGLLRSRAALQTEILVLRHQLNVLRRRAPKRVAVRNIDRLVFAGLYRLAPEVLDAVKILKPETIIRWHRAGFRAWWCWKSRPRGGRPRTPDEIRQPIRETSLANPLWGAPRIHGELLKLGIDVGQTTVAKYMARRRRPPSQGWKTFLRNHADAIASIDMSWAGYTIDMFEFEFPTGQGGKMIVSHAGEAASGGDDKMRICELRSLCPIDDGIMLEMGLDERATVSHRNVHRDIRRSSGTFAERPADRSDLGQRDVAA
jgi:hypothetical protein